jgi:hypothetical protein
MSFALDITQWAKEAGDEMAEFQRNFILAFFNSVIMDTPVDSGRLRGNWILSSDSPAQGTVDILDPTGNITTKKVEDYASKIGEKDFNVFLTNNLPYAYRIEYDGYSKIKSPQGMVRKNFIRISNNLANSKSL